MKTIKSTSLEEFYEHAAVFTGREISTLLPPGINKEIGHFNVFDIADTIEEYKRKAVMPYIRRDYYKNQPHSRTKHGGICRQGN